MCGLGCWPSVGVTLPTSKTVTYRPGTLLPTCNFPWEAAIVFLYVGCCFGKHLRGQQGGSGRFDLNSAHLASVAIFPPPVGPKETEWDC